MNKHYIAIAVLKNKFEEYEQNSKSSELDSILYAPVLRELQKTIDYLESCGELKIKFMQRQITLRCCECDRTLEVDAIEDDPIDAVELRGTACEKCDHGGSDQPTYWNKNGEQIL